MAKFQIYTYMFRPVMENQMEIPFEEFQKIDVQDSLDRKQDLTSEVLGDKNNLKSVSYTHLTLPTILLV